MPWQRARRRKSLLAHFVMNTETKREIPYLCRSSNIAIASHCPSNSLASPCICLVQHGVPWHNNFQTQLTKSSPLSNFQKVFLRDHLSALWNFKWKICRFLVQNQYLEFSKRCGEHYFLANGEKLLWFESAMLESLTENFCFQISNSSVCPAKPSREKFVH